MTVTNQNFRNNYIANGSNTSFSYTFKIFKNTDIAVYIDDTLISSGYTVTNAGNDAGGEVIFSIAPANNSRVTLIRNELFTQEINPGFGDNDPSQQIEEGLDRSVFRDQTLLELINRCLRLAPSSTALINIPNAEADKVIGWNSAGTALVNIEVLNGAVVVNPFKPAFYAVRATTQNIGNATVTKLQCNTEQFDSNAYYDHVTNFRFTPLVAGWYQVTISADFVDALASAQGAVLHLYKNGVSDFTVSDAQFDNGNARLSGTTVIFLNGSTDYIEMFGWIGGISANTIANARFSALFIGNF